MKRVLSFALALVMLVALSSTAFATKFVDSISNKGAPEVIPAGVKDGEEYIGEVIDPEGNVLHTVTHDCLVVTPVSEANTSTRIPEDARDLLLEVYDELSKPDTKLSTLCPELDDIVKAAFGDEYDADDLVVRDLFDATALCDELKQFLPIPGNTIDITFKLPLGADEFVSVIAYVDGVWKPIVKTVNNGDGTVTCTFEDICPIAFLTHVDSSSGSPDDPADTGDDAGMMMGVWGAVMAISLLAIIALIYVYRRNMIKNSGK